MMVAFLALCSGFCGHKRGAESGMVLSLGNCEKESRGKCASAYFYTFESSKHERRVSIGVGFTTVSPPKTCSACAHGIGIPPPGAHHADKMRTAHTKQVIPPSVLSWLTYQSFLHTGIHPTLPRITFALSEIRVKSSHSQKPADATLECDGQLPNE